MWILFQFESISKSHNEVSYKGNWVSFCFWSRILTECDQLIFFDLHSQNLSIKIQVTFLLLSQIESFFYMIHACLFSWRIIISYPCLEPLGIWSKNISQRYSLLQGEKYFGIMTLSEIKSACVFLHKHKWR